MSSASGIKGALTEAALWRWGPAVVALLVALPVLVIFSFLLRPAGEVWQHLADTVLQDYLAIRNFLG